MNRKGFLGKLLAIAVAPKLLKEECIEPVSIDEAKQSLTWDRYEVQHEDLKNMKPFKCNFRDLVSTTPNEKREHLGFVTYRESI